MHVELFPWVTAKEKWDRIFALEIHLKLYNKNYLSDCDLKYRSNNLINQGINFKGIETIPHRDVLIRMVYI